MLVADGAYEKPSACFLTVFYPRHSAYTHNFTGQMAFGFNRRVFMGLCRLRGHFL
jgi:hypothetical protein